MQSPLPDASNLVRPDPRIRAREAHRLGLAQRGGPLTAAIGRALADHGSSSYGTPDVGVQWITKHESKAGIFGRRHEPRWLRRARAQESKSSLRRARRTKIRVAASV